MSSPNTIHVVLIHIQAASDQAADVTQVGASVARMQDWVIDPCITDETRLSAAATASPDNSRSISNPMEASDMSGSPRAAQIGFTLSHLPSPAPEVSSIGVSYNAQLGNIGSPTTHPHNGLPSLQQSNPDYTNTQIENQHALAGREVNYFDVGMSPMDVDFFALLPGVSSDRFQDFNFMAFDMPMESMLPFDQASLSPNASLSGFVPQIESPQKASTSTATQARSFLEAQADGIHHRIPRIEKEPFIKAPRIAFSNALYAGMLSDLHTRLMIEQRNTFVIPNANVIQKSIQSYLDCFHPHLPIFHVPTMDLASMPSPLVLSMCAIGALYRLERKTAGLLFTIAELALQNSLPESKVLELQTVSDNFFSSTRNQSNSASTSPTWVVQCRLLLTFFAVFCWDSAVIRKASERLGPLTNVSTSG